MALSKHIDQIVEETQVATVPQVQYVYEGGDIEQYEGGHFQMEGGNKFPTKKEAKE